MKKIALVISSILMIPFFNQSFGIEGKTNIPTTIKSPPTTSNNSNFVIPSPPNLPVKAYVLMDANNGVILAAKNEEQRLPPASLTKLMTIYLTFKELSSEQVKLTDEVPISKKAWRTSGSRMFVQVGTKVTLEKLLQGSIVASGNDATTALAEYMAGTEDAFVQLMNQETKVLGMTNTNYTDPTGLPHPNHYTSAHDLATLTRNIINSYPQYYPYFSEKWFNYNNIRQPNRNRLLWSNLNVDGLKTGHTQAAGYCIAISAKKNNTRLIVVVLGAEKERLRTSFAQALLQYGFRFFQTTKLYSANQPVQTTRIYGGMNKYLEIGSFQNVAITLPVNEKKSVTADIKVNATLHAPIKKGQQLGTINIIVDGNIVSTQPLVALNDNPKGGWWRRFIDWFAFLFHKIF